MTTVNASTRSYALGKAWALNYKEILTLLLPLTLLGFLLGMVALLRGTLTTKWQGVCTMEGLTESNDIDLRVKCNDAEYVVGGNDLVRAYIKKPVPLQCSINKFDKASCSLADAEK